MARELTDIDVVIHYDTEKAILVSTDGDREEAVWLPKSVVEIYEHIEHGKVHEITLPLDMAIEKGLV